MDSYGHLIVSKLDGTGDDVDRLTFSVSPWDFIAREGSCAGLCFNPNQWSMINGLAFSMVDSDYLCVQGVLIMRFFVDIGKKVIRRFHLEEIQIGLDLVRILWGDGVIQGMVLLLTLVLLKDINKLLKYPVEDLKNSCSCLPICCSATSMVC